MSKLRTHVNRLLSIPVSRALDRVPALEQLASAHVDTRRLPIALARLQKRGLVIETVYDIGAHRGAWTAGVRRSLPGARFFLFEANEGLADALSKTGDTYFTVVLSSEEKPVEFFGAGTSGDSYFRELTERYASVPPTTRLATTLDQLIEEHSLPPAELDVLTGGAKALNHAKLVLLECPILPYNLGAPKIDEYFRFMDERGFTVPQFVDELWPDERMRHVDVLFGDVTVMEDLLR